MTCSPFDLNDYFLKELPEAGRRQVEAHLRECGGCREELERLRLTEATLFALREEEIPQRIAFVSDKVFEPAPWRRALAAFWGSAARLGFASAAMLSAAILFAALYRAPARVTTAGITPAEVQAQIKAAVDQAVHESEARESDRTEKLVADLLNREKAESKMLASAQDYVHYQDLRLAAAASQQYRQSSYQGGAQ
ncbi:MAG TPA: zf-HC2 domain-containing protein [Bryobacteraceae bacterium]|nr:zf-HC2 domain-containing protein [Bryobacteraceae bacterium]